MNLKFYEVDSEYIKYLKEKGDDKIPNIEYDKHKKFFCGIVLTINNFNYFAPVSSYTKKVRTAFLIKDKDKENNQLKVISSFREKIKKLANEVYKLGLNKDTRNKFNICDFKKLEEKCLEYIELMEN